MLNVLNNTSSGASTYALIFNARIRRQFTTTRSRHLVKLTTLWTQLSSDEPIYAFG